MEGFSISYLRLRLRHERKHLAGLRSLLASLVKNKERLLRVGYSEIGDVIDKQRQMIDKCKKEIAALSQAKAEARARRGLAVSPDTVRLPHDKAETHEPEKQKSTPIRPFTVISGGRRHAAPDRSPRGQPLVVIPGRGVVGLLSPAEIVVNLKVRGITIFVNDSGELAYEEQEDGSITETELTALARIRGNLLGYLARRTECTS